MKSLNRFKLSEESLSVVVLVTALAVFGLFMVYSASFYQSESLYGDKFLYLKKQVIGVLLGGFCMSAVIFFGVDALKKFWIILPIVSVVLLCLVFVPVIGIENYGAKRWINLGFFTLQPSEISKLAFVVFASTYYDKFYRKSGGFVGYLPYFALGGAFAALIILEPNLSVTVNVALITFLTAFAAGLNKKFTCLIIILGFLFVPLLIAIEPYRLSRIIAFINPWANPKTEGYQLIQSLYAIGNGGLFGVGYLNSRQALKFLPFSESDFIFSVIAEELGSIGAIAVILVYLLLTYLGLKKARYAVDRYNSMLAFSSTACFFVQAILNIAVVTGSIPPTGLPLPLISSGNTQIIVFMTLGGVIAAVKTDERLMKFNTI